MPGNRGHKLSDYIKLNEKKAKDKRKKQTQAWKQFGMTKKEGL